MSTSTADSTLRTLGRVGGLPGREERDEPNAVERRIPGEQRIHRPVAEGDTLRTALAIARVRVGRGKSDSEVREAPVHAGTTAAEVLALLALDGHHLYRANEKLPLAGDNDISTDVLSGVAFHASPAPRDAHE